VTYKDLKKYIWIQEDGERWYVTVSKSRGTLSVVNNRGERIMRWQGLRPLEIQCILNGFNKIKEVKVW
jgi:hypothetical protein